MNKDFIRSLDRKSDELRDVRVVYDIYGYASSSVLFEIGKTKVLCAVHLQPGVPSFLKGKKTGWLSAEYSMLPSSTTSRISRESISRKPNGRYIEISRIIGRSLRSIVDFKALGERTILIDCDVLQADGGTRTACITAACLALYGAVKHWLSTKKISKNILIDSIAAISAGVVSGQPLLDLDCSEDSQADADFNFVLTRSGKIVEIQGTSEASTISWDEFEQVRKLATKGISDLFVLFEQWQENSFIIDEHHYEPKKDGKPLFSLANRQKSVSIKSSSHEQ